MTQRRSSLSLALGLLAIGLWSASPAAAATQTVTLKSTRGDQATISLNKQTKRALARNHISLKTNRPATRKGNTANFPQRSGKWNVATTSGNVSYNGVSRFVRGKRMVKLSKLSFTRAVKGRKSAASLTAFFGHRKVTLLTLTGKVKVKMKGTRETVSGFTAKLSKKAASLLNAGLRHKAFKANQKIGSFWLTLTTGAKLVTAPGAPGSTGAPGTPGAAASAEPGAGLAFSPAFESVLGSSGLSATPLGSAANGILGGLNGITLPIGDGSSVTVPGLGGAPAGTAGFDNGVLTASVPLAGGLQLSNGTGSLSLTNPVVSLGTGIDGSGAVYASINGGPEVKVLSIDTSKLQAAATPGGQLDVNGLVTELSSELAASINQLAGRQVVQAGETVGPLSLIVPSSSAG